MVVLDLISRLRAILPMAISPGHSCCFWSQSIAFETVATRVSMAFTGLAGGRALFLWSYQFISGRRRPRQIFLASSSRAALRPLQPLSVPSGCAPAPA